MTDNERCQYHGGHGDCGEPRVSEAHGERPRGQNGGVHRFSLVPTSDPWSGDAGQSKRVTRDDVRTAVAATRSMIGGIVVVADAIFDALPTEHQDDGIVRGPLESGREAWMIVYEDPDHGHEVFSGFGAEQAAMRRFEQARKTWNCTLFRQYAPMGWTHTDRRGDEPPPVRDPRPDLAYAQDGSIVGRVVGWADGVPILERVDP